MLLDLPTREALAEPSRDLAVPSAEVIGPADRQFADHLEHQLDRPLPPELLGGALLGLHRPSPDVGEAAAEHLLDPARVVRVHGDALEDPPVLSLRLRRRPHHLRHRLRRARRRRSRPLRLRRPRCRSPGPPPAEPLVEAQATIDVDLGETIRPPDVEGPPRLSFDVDHRELLTDGAEEQQAGPHLDDTDEDCPLRRTEVMPPTPDEHRRRPVARAVPEPRALAESLDHLHRPRERADREGQDRRAAGIDEDDRPAIPAVARATVLDLSLIKRHLLVDGVELALGVRLVLGDDLAREPVVCPRLRRLDHGHDPDRTTLPRPRVEAHRHIWTGAITRVRRAAVQHAERPSRTSISILGSGLGGPIRARHLDTCSTRPRRKSSTKSSTSRAPTRAPSRAPTDAPTRAPTSAPSRALRRPSGRKIAEFFHLRRPQTSVQLEETGGGKRN